MTNSKLTLNCSSIIRVLCIMAFILIVLSILSVSADDLAEHNSVVFHKLNKLFFVEFEMNIPAFFSSLILLAASFILAVIAVFKRKQCDSYTMEWIALSVGFLFMSFDELVSVHERMIEPTREMLGNESLGIFYFAWVIPMGILVLSLAILFFRFWWDLPKKTKIFFLIAAVIYLGGAVGFELIESKHCEIYGKDNLIYIILTTTEESLEMFGVIFFIKSLLTYITETFGEVQLQLNSSPSEVGLLGLEGFKKTEVKNIA